MKNEQLKKELKEILANPKAVAVKGIVSGNSIDITIQEPFEDLGSFIYYDRADERDSDLDELEKLIRNVKHLKGKHEC